VTPGRGEERDHLMTREYHDPDDLHEPLLAIARALRDLGNGDAATRMGGLEAHAKVLSETGERIAGAIEGAGRAIADAIEGLGGSQ
jgi:hypothetical protein